jgi:RNA polymerase sigma-70 factor, ECF subfamily
MEVVALDDGNQEITEAMQGRASGDAAVRDRVVSLYEAHREGIYRFLVSHGMSPGEAQEAAQDVFVDLYAALKKGVDLQAPQAWLYAVAGRAAVDYWRRDRRHIRVQLELDESPAYGMASREPSPEELAGSSQRMRRLAVCLGQLPKEQRLCVQLRMQGLRYREIGEILGAPTSTVADWLVAAVASLREDLQ